MLATALLDCLSLRMNSKLTLTVEQLAAAREWIADCVWRDIDQDDVNQLTPDQVERGVARHFDGGIAGFKLCFN